MKYQWGKRGVTKLPDKVIGRYSQTLTIPELEESDEGTYYCTVTNMWNRSVEFNVTLNTYGMLVYYLLHK